MVPLRLRATLSTVGLVVGALLIGDALHGSVVTGAYPVTSPAAVLRAALGVALVAAGRRLKPPEEAYMPVSPDSDATDEEEADAEFDPELSPVGGESPEDGDGNRGRDDH